MVITFNDRTVLPFADSSVQMGVPSYLPATYYSDYDYSDYYSYSDYCLAACPAIYPAICPLPPCCLPCCLLL